MGSEWWCNTIPCVDNKSLISKYEDIWNTWPMKYDIGVTCQVTSTDVHAN